ncbi:MAG: ribonuclease Z [Rikenellaceae bacterium]|nr:ribonuclease Z [Rikenellaceae bacterium]
MNFRITVLGTGSALPAAGNHHSAHAVNVHEQYYLVDCGEGTQSRLYRYGINPLKIRAVFLTHLHGDHIYGIFPLLSTLGLMGKKTPLPVYAPEPFGEMLELYRRYTDADLPYEVRYHPVDTTAHGVVYENKVLTVSTVPLRHRKPAAGYLFREKTPPLNVRKETIEEYSLGIVQIVAAKRGEDITTGEGKTLPNSELTYMPYTPRSYAYISDTLYSGKVVKLVHGVDLLYHEATFSEADKATARATGHSTAVDAAKAASRSGAGELLIGHFSGRYKDPSILLQQAHEIFPRTSIAVEGRTYDIPLKKPDGK